MKKLTLLFLLLLAMPGFAAITLVQHTSGSVGSATSKAVAFGSNNTAGNLLVVSATAFNVGGPPTMTVADSNNTYTQAITRTDAGGPLYRASIWYVQNCAGGANTVTVTASGSAEIIVHIAEYSGVATASALDVTAGGDGISTTITTGSATTTQTDLVYGVALSNNQQPTIGSGFTTLENAVSSNDTNAEYLVQGAAGSQAAFWSNTGNTGRWIAVMATFKPAGGAVANSCTTRIALMGVGCMVVGGCVISIPFHAPPGMSCAQAVQVAQCGAVAAVQPTSPTDGTILIDPEPCP